MSVAQPLPIGFVSLFFGNFGLWLCQDYLYSILLKQYLYYTYALLRAIILAIVYALLDVP